MKNILSAAGTGGVGVLEGGAAAGVVPAELLKAWRERLGLSQAEGAKRLGVSTRTIEGWEQGKRPLPALWRRVEQEVAR